MKRVILTLAAAAMIASCDEMPQLPDTSIADAVKKQGLMFTSQINQPTKVGDTDFDVNDVISVSARKANGEVVKSSAQYTYNGSLFTSADPITYSSESAEFFEFSAVYPAIPLDSTAVAFNVESDQSTAKAYQASDLLYASITTSQLIPRLSFYHKMSSIVVSLVGDATGDMEFEAYTSAICDLSNDSFNAVLSKETVTPNYSSLSQQHKVIVVPQIIEAGETFATYEVGGSSYDWTVDEDLVLEPGKQYLFNWSLQSREVTLLSVINGWDVVNGGTVESK